ncbi:enoyl-CoA hydratase [Pseudomonas sp. NCCP-436]|uniref:enoyl-CoA hydratase n=1 Tax=Pseudomonas sp. NCCP-436 TaxID=2842481 RepID=UPI001C81E656|nr:enoyl-CoA hydratase [Pseudomonas sp. NCCP-436]GIZ13754.1 enoyl-CoA hydratase [Pseudomonas sp. NCCP-436]
MTYETLLIERHDRVVLITLNRPQALNALNQTLLRELNEVVCQFDRDPEISVMVLTGSTKAFAAGADIKEMADKTFQEAYLEDFFTIADNIASRRKPIIAAVAGYALGGGCELAMLCDTIFAADNARFGQPEINLGVLPGIGGSQRLTRAVGKAKAMDMCLTGRQMHAEEAERAGLVSRIIPTDKLLEETLAAAQVIAAKSLPSVLMNKECVNRAFESSLREGLLFERRVFHSVFALDDQKEGMRAFVEKRPPVFKHS